MRCPVTLFVHDGSAKGRVATQRTEPFSTAKDALRRVCEMIGSPGFVDPFITTPESPTEILWDTQELRQECERRAKAPPALAALADYVQANASTFVRNGPHLLSPAEATQRRNRIEELASELKDLAEKAREGLVNCPEFETVLGALHASGFFPETELVSEVARTLVRD